MDDALVEPLLQALQQGDEAVRAEATETLWQMWFQQKGIYGARLLMQSQELLHQGQLEDAEKLLSAIIQDQPDFAEAWNRRAVLYYSQQEFWKAIADCQATVERIPYHFGALHGLGLCHLALGNYTAAIEAFQKALQVQPHALINQRLVLECMAKLS
ncbi:MAG: tetratricopeptide repeat protein [Cyanobacteria bacterium P01_D01_bin.128]